ncbi:uncharacterized protein LY89DRAFT_742903 [Mollisia scopiformis]|uniref:Uncharacterized protein n=1 Tax=Mollisia scopiformis TaxID=149040 RepID=A0A132B4A5_MOLSC|nr:uncharacterized protein LY89DRAFT_742903 [Mollisia scopiformis]KUJ07255.1 hypothetical protein LY89DRAFT_742903 [Mollisia scopiformis]
MSDNIDVGLQALFDTEPEFDKQVPRKAMASLDPKDSLGGGGFGRAKVNDYGGYTPEATPEPNPSKTSTETEPEITVTRVDDDDDDIVDHDPEMIQRAQALQRVSSTKNKKKILNLPSDWSSASISTPEGKEQALAAYQATILLIHPKLYRKTSDHEFLKVNGAALSYGVPMEYLDLISNWDGQGPLPRPAGSGFPTPNGTILKILYEATDYMQPLWLDPSNLTVLQALSKLNERIQAQNEKDGNTRDNCIIDCGTIGSAYLNGKPIRDALLHDLNNLSLMMQWKEWQDKMNSFTNERKYPNWTPPTPTKDELNNVNEAAAQAEAQISAQAAAAAAQAEAQRLAEEAAARKAGQTLNAGGSSDTQYPWNTLVTTDGRRVIAGRQHTKLGEDQGRSTLIVASKLGPDPIYDLISGTSIKAEEEIRFFAMLGIKRLAERRSNGEKAKTWTWRDKPNFIKFLWCTKGRRIMATFGKGTKAADTLCCIEMASGIEICTRSDFGDILGKGRADKEITVYCER